jgi:pimeloyl-ACP methyl ester carboxylesterase
MAISSHTGAAENARFLTMTLASRRRRTWRSRLAGPAIARAKALNPRVRSIVYAGSGHAPFLEEPERFNRDLAAFMQSLAR